MPTKTENERIFPEPLAIDKFYGISFPKQEWIFDRVIPKDGLIALSGAPGSYKSFFALWMALQAGMGKPLFNAEQIIGNNQSELKTLFIEEENTLRLMHQRVRVLKNGKSRNVFFKIDDGFKMQDDEARANVIQFCMFNSISLVVLDPFSSVMGLKDENNNAEVSVIMDIIRKTFVAQGISVMFIHHPAKNAEGGKNLRGAGDILGKCDVHISMEKDEQDKKLITISYEKMRLISEDDIWDFKVKFSGDEIMGYEFVYLDEAKPKYQEERETMLADMLKLMQPMVEYKQKEITELLGTAKQNRRFQAIWSEAIKEGWIVQNVTSKLYYKA
jgi:hypothetical protein